MKLKFLDKGVPVLDYRSKGKEFDVVDTIMVEIPERITKKLVKYFKAVSKAYNPLDCVVEMSNTILHAASLVINDEKLDKLYPGCNFVPIMSTRIINRMMVDFDVIKFEESE